MGLWSQIMVWSQSSPIDLALFVGKETHKFPMDMFVTWLKFYGLQHWIQEFSP